MNSLGQTFGIKLKQIRESQKKTQEWLAEKIGVKRATILRWEKGGGDKAALEHVEAISKTIEGTSIEELLGLGPSNTALLKLKELKNRRDTVLAKLSEARISYTEINAACEEHGLEEELINESRTVESLQVSFKAIQNEVDFLEKVLHPEMHNLTRENSSKAMPDPTSQEIISLLPSLDEEEKNSILKEAQSFVARKHKKATILTAAESSPFDDEDKPKKKKASG